MNDFSEKRDQLERKFEDLLIEVSGIKTPNGRVIFAGQLLLINEFKDMIDKVEWSYLRDKDISIPKLGAESNEN